MTAVRVLGSIVAGITISIGGALAVTWADSRAHERRIAALEAQQAESMRILERLARIEEQVRAVRDEIARDRHGWHDSGASR